MCDYGVALNVGRELPSGKSLPIILRSAIIRAARFSAASHAADFDVFILNTIILAPRTICRFEAKAHRHQRHDPVPRFPARDYKNRR